MLLGFRGIIKKTIVKRNSTSYFMLLEVFIYILSEKTSDKKSS